MKNERFIKEMKLQREDFVKLIAKLHIPSIQKNVLENQVIAFDALLHEYCNKEQIQIFDTLKKNETSSPNLFHPI